MTVSVLIPSYRRPDALRRCLASIASQQHPPDEIVVVWQGDDEPTRRAADEFAATQKRAGRDCVRVIQLDSPNIVAAENAGLRASSGNIVMLIDDDAVARPTWIQHHLSHYDDPRVGAVGGSADNFRPDGTPFPRREVIPQGRLTWYGKTIGNMYDHPESWRQRPVQAVDHLVGYNLSIRREALDRFEDGLRPYWQLFELDACMKIRARGYQVLFDFDNVVAHHPTNTAYAGGRDGDLDQKCVNPSYNHAFVLAKHTGIVWQRAARWTYLFLVGSVNTPGAVGAVVASFRFGKPLRELELLKRCWMAKAAGWRDGAAARRQLREQST